MKLSIIIVTWNSANTIQKCLDSLKNIKMDKEVIALDNNSSDSTFQILKKHPEVKAIVNSDNRGYGKASNQGIKIANGEFILLLNPDTEVKKDSVETMLGFLEGNREVFVIGPKLTDESVKVLNEATDFPNLLNQSIISLKLHRVPFFKKLVYQKFDYTKTQEANHLMGAAILIRRETLIKLGGFDENFFLWFEDTDLLKRIKDKGYKIIYYPEAAVTHLVGQSTKQLSFWKRQTIWNKSLIYYFSKHKTWLHVLILLPFILLSYPAAIITKLAKH